jgi:hypothetical protein
MIDLPNGIVTFADGNLSEPLAHSFILRTNNTVLMATTNNRVKLTLSMNTGLMTGSFQHPDNTNKTTSFSGVVLQQQNYGGGAFLGTNQSGSVLLGGE